MPWNYIDYKKVLLRDRKRHTVRHIASTCSPVPYLGEGGIPIPAIPSLELGVHPCELGYRQTPVKTLPSHPWDAGGKNYINPF